MRLRRDLIHHAAMVKRLRVIGLTAMQWLLVVVAGCVCMGQKARAASVTPAGWSRQGVVQGLCCSYTPLVIKDGRPHFFSNVLDRATEGEWVRYAGNSAAVTSGQVVLSASSITDVGSAAYKVRTSGVRHDPAVGWVAILRVGRGYPTEDVYVPAMATSSVGLAGAGAPAPVCAAWFQHVQVSW